MLADANRCLDLIKGRLDAAGQVILDARTTSASLEQAKLLVAAALFLLCSRFSKKNGKSNPSAAAAAACGKLTNLPVRVTEWLEKLEKLEASLTSEETTAALLKRSREEAAPLSHPNKACIDAAERRRRNCQKSRNHVDRCTCRRNRSTCASGRRRCNGRRERQAYPTKQTANIRWRGQGCTSAYSR